VAEASLKEVRDAFRALADTTRLRLLLHVAQAREIAVCDLARATRTSQPLVSWHLAILKRAGLVTTRREGRLVYCAIAAGSLDRCQRLLDQLAAGAVASVPADATTPAPVRRDLPGRAAP